MNSRSKNRVGLLPGAYIYLLCGKSLVARPRHRNSIPIYGFAVEFLLARQSSSGAWLCARLFPLKWKLVRLCPIRSNTLFGISQVKEQDAVFEIEKVVRLPAQMLFRFLFDFEEFIRSFVERIDTGLPVRSSAIAVKRPCQIMRN